VILFNFLLSKRPPPRLRCHPAGRKCTSRFAAPRDRGDAGGCGRASPVRPFGLFRNPRCPPDIPARRRAPRGAVVRHLSLARNIRIRRSAFAVAWSRSHRLFDRPPGITGARSIRVWFDRRRGRSRCAPRPRPREISRRSLQPASRHARSAAGQPVGDRVSTCCAVRPGRARHAVLVALRWRMNVMSLPDEGRASLCVATGPLRKPSSQRTPWSPRPASPPPIIAGLGSSSASGSVAVGPYFAAAAAGRGRFSRGGYLLLIDTLLRTRRKSRFRAASHRCGIGTPFFQLAARHRAEDWSMSLEGDQLTSGRSGPRVGTSLDVRLETGEVLALLFRMAAARPRC